MTGAIFSARILLMQKNWLSYDDQLELLTRRGMRIEDERAAIRILSCVSYYRLSGYFRYWQKDPTYGDNDFISGTSFSRIYQLYEAERELANACKALLATCEILVRTRFAYHYGTCVGPVATFARGVGFTPPPSPDIDPVEERILSDLDRSKDIFVAHYRDEIKQGSRYLPAAYDRMPIWVAVEVLSFGCLSRMITASGESGVLERIAKSLNTSRAVLPSQVRSFVYLRNRCSHYGRLWNTAVTDEAAIPKNTKRRIQSRYRSFDKHSAYQIFAALHDLADRAELCADWLGTVIEPLLQADPLLAYGIATPKKYGYMPEELLAGVDS